MGRNSTHVPAVQLAPEAIRRKDWAMPGPTICPFCQSSRIRARLPVQDLCEYGCDVCTRTWLVARPKRQAKIVRFPSAAARARRRAGGSTGS